MNDRKQNKIFLKVSEVVEQYGISRSAIYQRIASKELTKHKFGTATLLRREDVEALITPEATA